MTAKGTWEAVEFVPYSQSTRQKSPTIPRQSDKSSVAPDSSPPEPVRETIETPSPGQTETDPEKKPKFGTASDYQKFDFGLDLTKD